MIWLGSMLESSEWEEEVMRVGAMKLHRDLENNSVWTNGNVLLISSRELVIFKNISTDISKKTVLLFFF